MVLKNAPSDFHKMAIPAAKAALAAQAQGKFWQFHDLLFAEKKLSKRIFKKIAGKLDLDIARFEKDSASVEIGKMLQTDILDAQKAGVRGTPTIFLNGRHPIQQDLGGFQTIIDDELRKLGGM